MSRFMAVRHFLSVALLVFTAACLHGRRITEHPIAAANLAYIRSVGCGDTAYARQLLAGEETRSTDERVRAAARDDQWPDRVALGRAVPRYAVTDPVECADMLEPILRRIGGAEAWSPNAPTRPGRVGVRTFALVRFGTVDLFYYRYYMLLPAGRDTTRFIAEEHGLFMYLERGGKRRGAGFIAG
jgi:hypothetical protein